VAHHLGHISFHRETTLEYEQSEPTDQKFKSTFLLCQKGTGIGYSILHDPCKKNAEKTHDKVKRKSRK
jgi:hypothetical protein